MTTVYDSLIYNMTVKHAQNSNWACFPQVSCMMHLILNKSAKLTQNTHIKFVENSMEMRIWCKLLHLHLTPIWTPPATGVHIIRPVFQVYEKRHDSGTQGSALKENMSYEFPLHRVNVQQVSLEWLENCMMTPV